MNKKALEALLQEVRDGATGIDEALNRLKLLPFEETEFATIDHHREIRCGFPEVIFCQDKRAEDILGIARILYEKSGRLLATRIAPEAAAVVQKEIPSAIYCECSRTLTASREKIEQTGLVVIVSAGTSDLPVAEEARVTAEIMGAKVETITDSGVAGIHRLLSKTKRLRAARVVVAVAGMEGALASVVGGLVDVPVIAVPTSVGYGASFGGIAPLLTMLNSCAAGVSVVNIDNGFGAGYTAALINSLPERTSDETQEKN